MENNRQITTTFEVRLSDYTCPLDVLLELIRKKKVEITEIKLFDLIEQYNDFLQNSINDLPIEEFAEYLVMNSFLLSLKTKALLLDEGMDAKLGSIEDASDLMERLIEHAKYKKSVGFFQDMFNKRQTMIDKTAEDYDDYSLENIPVGKLPKKINIERLQVYFQKIVDEVIENSYEKSNELFREKVEFTQYSIKSIQKDIINYLEKQDNKKDTLLNCFLNNLDSNLTRGYFSAFFLAILTLVKYSIITITEYDEESYIVHLEDNIDLKLLDLINEE